MSRVHVSLDVARACLARRDMHLLKHRHSSPHSRSLSKAEGETRTHLLAAEKERHRHDRSVSKAHNTHRYQTHTTHIAIKGQVTQWCNRRNHVKSTSLRISNIQRGQEKERQEGVGVDIDGCGDTENVGCLCKPIKPIHHPLCSQLPPQLLTTHTTPPFKTRQQRQARAKSTCPSANSTCPSANSTPPSAKAPASTTPHYHPLTPTPHYHPLTPQGLHSARVHFKGACQACMPWMP